jgi:HD-like signal output (HDOD) protein
MTTPADSQLSPLLRGFEIPPCPAILGELRTLLDAETFDARRVSQLISRDVALAASVIRIANSPALGLQRQASSITQALALLGSRQILNLVVGQLLKRAGDSNPGLRLERFWDRAALSANVCSQLVGRLRGSSRDAAYCFGLFRDCGIPLMMRRFPDYKATLQVANRSDSSFTAVEESRHGVDHAVIGYLLARSWRLSDTLCAAIRSHHDFAALDHDSGLGGETCSLIGIGVVAERIVSLFQHSPDENEWRQGRSPVAHYFNLSESELDDAVEDELDHLRANGG